MHGNDSSGVAAHDRRRGTWPATALLALGAWLVVSPLVLSTTRVTAGTASAAIAGVGLCVLGGWARAHRDRIAPWVIALPAGVWLLLVPSMWEFHDGVDTWQLVPVPAWQVTEPARALIARAEWNSVLVGLLVLALAGSVLVATWRRSALGGGLGHGRQLEVPGGRR